MKIFIIFKYNASYISTSNYMFGRAIYDKLPECTFADFEISKFSKIARVIYPQNRPNQACGSHQTKKKTFYIETNIF